MPSIGGIPLRTGSQYSQEATRKLGDDASSPHLNPGRISRGGAEWGDDGFSIVHR